MLLRRLTLSNFRNFEDLDVRLGPRLTVVHGDNGQGKSNLLEAIYLLAIGKSYRSQTERELVRWDAQASGLGLVAGSVEHAAGDTELRVGLDLRGGGGLQKRVRVNGVAKRTSGLLGLLNAVLFSADDIELVYGSPQGRRRYLDVLLSQTSAHYLHALQRYQRVLAQRNHLLRSLREGRAGEDELAFWDGELCREGAAVLAPRLEATALLGPLIAEAYERFAADGGGLEIEYTATAPVSDAGTPDALAAAMAAAIEASRRQERASAQTLVGPHRDDLRLVQHGVELGRHASRGQARLAALSLRLAEAHLLWVRRGEPPVLLLDDILSELDVARREMVMREVAAYPQALLTTADLGIVPEAARVQARVLRVDGASLLEETPGLSPPILI